MELKKLDFFVYRTKHLLKQKQGSINDLVLNLYVVTDMHSHVNFALAVDPNIDFYMLLSQEDIKQLVNTEGMLFKVIGGFYTDDARSYITTRDPLLIIEEILEEESFRSQKVRNRIYDDIVSYYERKEM